MARQLQFLLKGCNHLQAWLSKLCFSEKLERRLDWIGCGSADHAWCGTRFHRLDWATSLRVSGARPEGGE